MSGRTICCATTAEDRIAASVLDRGHDGARWRSAFDEDELILEVRLYLLDACSEVD